MFVSLAKRLNNNNNNNNNMSSVVTSKLSLPKDWYGLWIDGKEVESLSKKSFDVENPADGSVIARVAGKIQGERWLVFVLVHNR